MTKEIKVRGMQTDGEMMRIRPLVVRITTDELGMSLSISNEDDVMLLIPIEPIADELRQALKKRKSNGITS